MGTSSSETLLPRYERVRVLGRGGMGAVWLVEDAERGQRVAMKRVLGVHGEALVRFKREFRVVEGLLHPNVVRLYELGEDEGGLFFTMEVVEGSDLLSWCRAVRRPPEESGTISRRPSASDTIDAGAATQRTESDPSSGAPRVRAKGELRVERLAHALPQILEALAFLHGHGIVHRDLKPSNVMVRDDGVVKILDFGILGEHARAADAEVVGTVGYMAPEQIRGVPPTPESDLYSLGCMLFELAAGHPPFHGAPMAVMARQLTTEPPRLRDAAPDAPAALDAACEALMRSEPRARPSLERLAEMLLPALGARRPAFPPPRPPSVDLVGRAREVARAQRALDAVASGSFETIVIAGPTGAGKTALAARAADEAARRGMSVLRGRGRATERVAFNALDGAIDELASVLGRRTRRESAAIGRARRRAAAAFPALTRKRESGGSVPPPSGRRQVFDALTELVATVAAEARGALIWIDDLQWADADSLALLDHLIEAAPAHLLVLATLRDDVGETLAGRWTRAQRAIETLEVPPLSAGELSEIIERALAQTGGTNVAPSVVADLATRCEGRPFLAELAARSLSREPDGGGVGSLERWLERDIALRSEGARELVGLLVAADGWSPIGELAAVAGRLPGEVEEDLKQLEVHGLVRRAGVPGITGVVDLYHDVVRAAAVRALGDAAVRNAHDRFASHLERSMGPAHRRVRHLIGAGRDREAARLAPAAARDAEAVRAYALAADMYEIALRAPTDADALPLRRARANALERGGRYVEAAREWRSVADGGGDGAADAVLREAHALLAANDVEAGRRRLDEGLVASGEPRSGRGGLSALFSAMGFLRGPSAPREVESEPDAEVLSRAERDVRIGTMVTYFDPLSGIRFLRRARAAFAAQGAALEAGKADWVFAYLALFGAKKRGPVPLAEAYAASARSWLDRARTQDPIARAYPAFHAGVAAQRDGAWDEAAPALDEAVDVLERAGLSGTFEHMLALVHRAQIDIYGQRLDRVAASVGRLVAAARDSDDTAIHCHVALAQAMHAGLCGEHEAMLSLVEPVARTWSIGEPTFQRILVDVVCAFPTVYLGGAHDARVRLASAFRDARRFRPLATMYGGSLGSLWALVEAAALRTGDRGASPRRVRRLAKLAAVAPPLGTPMAHRAAAYVDDEQGRTERALERLEMARALAERFGLCVDVAIADHQIGVRSGGDSGAARRAAARAACEALGVRPCVLDEDPGVR